MCICIFHSAFQRKMHASARPACAGSYYFDSTFCAIGVGQTLAHLRYAKAGVLRRRKLCAAVGGRWCTGCIKPRPVVIDLYTNQRALPACLHHDVPTGYVGFQAVHDGVFYQALQK